MHNIRLRHKHKLRHQLRLNLGLVGLTRLGAYNEGRVTSRMPRAVGGISGVLLLLQGVPDDSESP